MLFSQFLAIFSSLKAPDPRKPQLRNPGQVLLAVVGPVDLKKAFDCKVANARGSDHTAVIPDQMLAAGNVQLSRDCICLVKKNRL